MKSGVFNYYGLRNNDHDIQLSPDHLFGNRDYCCRGSNPIDTKIERRFDAAGDVRSFQKGDKGELGEYQKNFGAGDDGSENSYNGSGRASGFRSQVHVYAGDVDG